MRTSEDPANTPENEQPEVDTSDKYPTAVEGLRRILDEADFDDVPIEFITCEFLGSGEAVWRIREPRAEEGRGGYLPPP